MNKDCAILIKNKKVISLIKKLLEEKYRQDGFIYHVNRVDVLLEALELLKEKYERDKS